MSIFHKNINEKLAQHIFELQRIGLLTDQWYWDSQRVYELERIDEQLIKDLLELYKTRRADKEKFEQILQRLSVLQRILKKFMKESKADSSDRRFVILINKFVQEIETMLDKFPLRIGVTGFITQKFDEQQALKYLRKAFDKIEKGYPRRKKEIVGKNIDLGIYAIAYREAVRRKWKTVGIPYPEFENFRKFPVNEVVQKSIDYSVYSLFFEMIDIIVRVGGLYRAIDEVSEAKRANKEIYEYNVKADLRTIADIDAIQESRNSYIKTRKDLSKFVEVPLLKAFLVLYDKNVQVMSTSANSKDVGHHAYININYDTLSDENEVIGRKFGQISFADGFNHLSIQLPIKNSSVRVNEIEKYFVDIANAFKPQKMTWARTYTWEQLLKIYATTPEQAKRKGWTPKTFSDNYYYDQKERLFYLSEEHYRKSKR